MSFKRLLDHWQQTAPPTLTATEYAVRLPVDDAARVQALVEMYPGASREQIITDLIGAALKELAASMPYVTNGNIYAPVMMVAEKAADLILGNTPLPKEDAAFHRHIRALRSDSRTA